MVMFLGPLFKSRRYPEPRTQDDPTIPVATSDIDLWSFVPFAEELATLCMVAELYSRIFHAM